MYCISAFIEPQSMHFKDFELRKRNKGKPTHFNFLAFLFCPDVACASLQNEEYAKAVLLHCHSESVFKTNMQRQC